MALLLLSALSGLPSGLPSPWISLYSVTWQSFVRMGDGASHSSHDLYLDRSRMWPHNNRVPQLPANWSWEIFKAVRGVNDTIGLWSPVHQAYVSVPCNTNSTKERVVRVAGHPNELLASDREVMLEVVHVGHAEQIQNSRTIALWNPHCQSFLRMLGSKSANHPHANGPYIDQSAPVADKELPPSWTWEQFIIVNAADAMISLQDQELRSLRSTVSALQASVESLASQLPCITSEIGADNLSCTLRPKSPLQKLQLTA